MKTTLPVQEVNLYNNLSTFSDIPELKPIPSNTIIDKTLPGIGATYCEIKEHRSSILILPNVATIISKQEKHKESDNTFALYEGVTKDALIAYLKSDVQFKKILTTPESFTNRLKKAIGTSIYNDYFLLIDESHKVITDNAYRKDIVMPMDDFFTFKNKAMISATSIIPSDQRFLEHRFKLLKVVPKFEYKQDVTIVKTSNTLHYLLSFMKDIPSDNYCIFFNSIQGITSIIETMLNLYGKDEVDSNYKIFCSKESSQELNRKGFQNAFFKFTECGKYNFFTSSFYNGLDIDYKGDNADVIVISDVKYVDHSVIDPLTDAIQIRGRFRPYIQDGVKVEWVNSYTHVITTDKGMACLTEEEAKLKIEHTGTFYKYVSDFKLAATSAITQDDVQAILNRINPYANLLNKDQTLNSYKVDNYHYKERVKRYYLHLENLHNAYTESGRFSILLEDAMFKDKGLERLKYSEGKYSPENYAAITDLLWEVEGEPTYYPNQLMVTELYRHFELIVRAYFELGMEWIVAYRFQHKYIKQALAIVDGHNGVNKFPVIDAIHAEFKPNYVYELANVKEAIQKIYSMFNVNVKGTVTAQFLAIYFEVKPARKKGQKALKVIRPIHNGHYDRV